MPWLRAARRRLRPRGTRASTWTTVRARPRARARRASSRAAAHASPPRARARAGWEEKSPARDPTTHELRADTKRFPSGMKALGDYVHAKGLSFAIYSAESTETCGGYPASLGYEALDATTFASWGVDYIKVRGGGVQQIVRRDRDQQTIGQRAKGGQGDRTVHEMAW